jgi:predicted MPP superfamily phosphohydrolase
MHESAPAERRAELPSGKRRNRRAPRTRRSLELLCDAVFRPGFWAARLARLLQLQGSGGVRLRNHLVPLASRRAGSTPLRIAFASDFHAGPTTDPRLLDEACDILADARPDVLLLGGDFVSVRANYIDRLAKALSRIDAPLGKYGVPGNHDLRADHDRWRNALTGIGIELLINRSVTLPAPHDDISIVGLDDPIFGDPDAERAFADTAGHRIVLMHAPDGLLDIGDRDFAVALCGHTHGGQVATPWGRPLVVPRGRLSRRYSGGFERLDPNGRRALLVSRGVGCSVIPLRLFAHPEVHILTVG